jgi:hypothetical protein
VSEWRACAVAASWALCFRQWSHCARRVTVRVRSKSADTCNGRTEERSAGEGAELARRREPHARTSAPERAGRVPYAVPDVARRGHASGSAVADKPAFAVGLPAAHGTCRRGRGGARAIQTIPEARLWPACMPGATGARRTERRAWATGGAPEHRPSVSLAGRDHPAECREWR